MRVAKVIGTVVSTRKNERLEGFKLLLVQPVYLHKQKPEGDPIVAVDIVGAGEGEIVLYVQGSSARMSDVTDGKPVDTAITAIIDYLEVGGELTFRKS